MPKKVTTFNIDSDILDAAKLNAKDAKQSLSAYVESAILSYNLSAPGKIVVFSESAPSEPETPVFKVQ